ncbi:MAG TPA: ATP-binding cassette domain-containing protein [Thermoanaerobaculia bacterium]|nr:ATP-binding cassette domain-containing protein [Thermoanaerobaculia bacterium]
MTGGHEDADGEVVVRVRGVRKAFGSHTVLDGVDLDIRRGEALIILGGSGSGKSTLLRVMLGLERPDEGSVEVGGVDIHHASDEELRVVRERIGMAFQGGALFGSMSVADNLDLPLREFTELPASTRSIVIRIKLSLVGLGGAEHKMPSELSGGMKKRAAFARAMALDPELLFCDEPSAGLDPVTAAGLDRLLLRLQRVFGVTLVVVTHELESAFAIGDRLALLHRGTVRALGTVDEIRRSQDGVVRRFLDRQADVEQESTATFEELGALGREAEGAEANAQEESRVGS